MTSDDHDTHPTDRPDDRGSDQAVDAVASDTSSVRADHDTGRDGTADAGSEWLLFDPGTRELVDLPAGHPFRAMLEQSTPLVLDDDLGDVLEDAAQFEDEDVDDDVLFEVDVYADRPGVMTAEEEAFARATFARVGQEYPVELDPRDALSVAWIYEEASGQHYPALQAAAEGDLSKVRTVDDVEAHRRHLCLPADHPTVRAARAEVQAHTLTLGTTAPTNTPAASTGARNALYPYGRTPARDTTTRASTAGATAAGVGGAGVGAVETDRQWWTDRAHDTHDVADTTRTAMASDASSGVFSDEAGADQDDGWSR